MLKSSELDWENTVSIRSNLNERQADHEPAEGIGAALAKASEVGRPFVVPWQLNASAARPGWEDLGDASCGSGPSE